MKNCIKLFIAIANATIGLTLINSQIVEAATIDYDFQVEIDSGALVGESFLGSFSFDDMSLTSVGEEFLPLDSISFNFLDTDYTEVDLPSAEAAFLDGEFLGLSYSPDESLAFIPGFFSLDEAYFTYDLTDVGTGFGDVAYTWQDEDGDDGNGGSDRTTPEASSIFGLLFLGLLGVAFRSTKKIL